MKTMNLALPMQSLRFGFIVPADWDANPLTLAFRVRGCLGLALKKNCCFFDAHKTPCEGCDKRAVCHYGQSFEVLPAPSLTNMGKAGSMPHAWSLAVDLKGLRAEVCIRLIGLEIAHTPSWRAAIEKMSVPTYWLADTSDISCFSLSWRSITPVSVRKNGKEAKTYDDISASIAISVVQKMKMLASINGALMPDSFLTNPVCSHKSWHEGERFAFRHQKKQQIGGWMLDVVWQDVPEDWQPWLALALKLGVGRHTSFGLGRFETLKE